MTSKQIYKKLVDTEWNYEKNNKLKLNPLKITYGSQKKVWWKCKKGHEWNVSPNSRTMHESTCPFCCGRKVCENNCLLTTHPHIAEEWHPTKNGKLTPENLTFGSTKTIWFQCEKNHEYKTRLNNRCGKKKYGCPTCSGRKLCKNNCLSATHPNLSKEWHLTKNKKLTPNDVSRSSNQKVWWKCSLNHVWKAVISSRTYGAKSICPKCARAKISGKNHYNYNHNLTDEDRMSRRDIKECVIWRKVVFTKDDYICEICNIRWGNLAAHHLMGWNNNPHLRFNKNNGVTLCKKCHLDFHSIYGKGNNTTQQFIEYKTNVYASNIPPTSTSTCIPITVAIIG